MPPIDYSKDNVLYGTRRADVIEALGGSDTVYGRAGNDELYGGRGNDFVSGDNGDDRVDGGRGEDAMEGGGGNDAYYIDNVRDRAVETPSDPGIDIVYSSVNWTLGSAFENLRLYTGASIGKGNELANVIEGNSGANRLYGRDGNDTLIGNKGDDTLFGQNGDDVLWGGGRETIYTDNYEFTLDNDGADVLDGGEGLDTLALQAAFSFYEDGWEYEESSISLDAVVDLDKGTLGYDEDGHSADHLISIENVQATSADDRIYGDEGDNVIRTGDGVNIASGRDGDDTIIGGEGSDTIGYGDYADKLYGGDGDDTIISNDAFMLYDNSRFSYDWAHERLSGGDGNDRLVSGFGLIDMYGGDGEDQFEFSNELFGLVEVSEYYGDTGMRASVMDFSRGEGDRIALNILEDDRSFSGTPEWVGNGELQKAGDVGWQHVTDENGDEDTVITMRLLDPEGWRSEADLTITLEDWAYTLRESDFAFVLA